MAKFKPGNPKPPNSGRKKGDKNTATVVSEVLAAREFNTLDKIIDLIESGRLTDKETADSLFKLLEYQFPKKKAVEYTGADGEPLAVRMISPTLQERLALVEGIRALRKKD